MMISCWKHVLHLIALFSLVAAIEFNTVGFATRVSEDPKQQGEYFKALTIIVTCMQSLIALHLPQILCNFLGLTFFNAFPGDIKVQEQNHDSDGSSSRKREVCNEDDDGTSISEQKKKLNLSLPHFCFRVVTRGLFPNLVQENIRKNYSTCIRAGLEDFSIEIVTDRDILLSSMSVDQSKIRQVLVPNSYKTSTGAMFKARALQYALEPGHSPAPDSCYVIHLDEETIITENSINGIINFSIKGEHAFGQGMITYANLGIVNLITTFADSYRVADDMGKLRFTLKSVHRPLFGWKGSYVVTRLEAEKDVSFDHGPDGSIAEDCYFAMEAMRRGYTFDFIRGEMYEKSPFTIGDLIRQRKRWIQGIGLVVTSSKIPIRVKFFLIISYTAWSTLPITTLSFILTTLLPIPIPIWLPIIGQFCFAVTLYMYLFGLVKSFDLKNKHVCMFFVYFIGQILTLVISTVIENIAVIWALATPKHTFYIVKKDIDQKVVCDS